MKLSLLEHLTHLDIRDNQIGELDLRAVRTIEYLNVDRNHITSLHINGMQLKNLFASHNRKFHLFHLWQTLIIVCLYAGFWQH